ncbi:MAG: dicarboxylate/amino acid:cation symporter [Halieaceae bacterium]|nr:dicarboxylate/amino acid:cation symporter [Halieaceae bacterium]
MIRTQPTWVLTLFGLLAGLALGLLAPSVSGWIQPIGQLFLQALKLLVVPLVLVSITHAVGSVSDVGTAGRMGGYALVWYVGTTFTVIPLGYLISSFSSIEPLAHLQMEQTYEVADSVGFDWAQIVPVNIVSTMAEGNVLGLIVFSIALGVAANQSGESGRPFRDFMESAMAVVQSLTKIIISFAPLGVFSLMASTTAQYGLEVLKPLVQLIGLVYLGCILHLVVTLNVLLKLGAGVSLWQFIGAVFPAQLMAFSTTTAAGTLPESMRCAEDNLQVRPSVSRFVLPIGATLNMDGTALYQLLVSLFVAQWYGIELSISQHVILALTVVLMSIGTAAIPSGGLVVLSAVLTSVGLPIEAVAIVAGIDRILDMARTTVNVSGDLAVTTIIDRRLRALNE